jgi:hypothetical protein
MCQNFELSVSKQQPSNNEITILAYDNVAHIFQ